MDGGRGECRFADGHIFCLFRAGRALSNSSFRLTRHGLACMNFQYPVFVLNLKPPFQYDFGFSRFGLLSMFCSSPVYSSINLDLVQKGGMIYDCVVSVGSVEFPFMCPVEGCHCPHFMMYPDLK